jgi:hypothetical protein
MLVTFPDPDDYLGPSKGFGSSTCFFMLAFRIHGIFIWGWLGILKIKQIDDTKWHIIIFRLNIAILVFFPMFCDIFCCVHGPRGPGGTSLEPLRDQRGLGECSHGGRPGGPETGQGNLGCSQRYVGSISTGDQWGSHLLGLVEWSAGGGRKKHIWKKMAMFGPWTKNS